MGSRLDATSPNRVYLVRASPSPKSLASLGTSDIIKALSEIFEGT